MAGAVGTVELATTREVQRKAPEVNTTPETIHAEATGDSVTVTPEVQATPVVASASRTITGRVLPWEEFGRTSGGAIKFAPGGIRVPRSIDRVKLLAGHSPTGVPVGHATGWESKPDGLYMTFALGTSPEADATLVAAAEKTIDAFSVEATITERDGTTITNGVLTAVAMVPIPAYANARVETVVAELDAGGEEAPGDPHRTEDTDQTTPDNTEDPDNGDDTDADDDKDTDMGNLTPGIIPGANAATPTATPVKANLRNMVDYLLAANAGEDVDLDAIHAELVDITDASTSESEPPVWVGELWSGVTYQRRIIPLMASASLTGRKATGYRWVTKPGVDKWTGNKTEIPSFGASVEPVEMDATYWAGGNDIDRTIFDFKETDKLAAYWRFMVESYALKTDEDAAKFLIASATEIPGGADGIIDAALTASLQIDEDLHSPATFTIINPADYKSILAMVTMDKPLFMDTIPHLNPSKWVRSTFVPQGTMIVGAKSAATHYELPGSPIRVEAEHIAKGGRDRALFGYTANLLVKPEGLRKITFTTPTPPVEG